jgi:asparagine synthase (glutamine-hydrolysing)
MCGLAGFLDLTDGTAADPAVLRKMIGAIAHRGPDDTGAFVDGPLAIGFQRLSIQDVAGGAQPFFSEDGRVVLFCNGEILNHRELRAALIRRGHRFRSCCDVEVLVHLYEEHGIECLNHLNGQFAVALYDAEIRTLFLARDHCGIAPLHYAEFGGTLIFGSEIKAILEHPLACRRVDLQALDQVLTFPGLVSPRTMFDGVRSLPPGHYIRVRDGRPTVFEYWDLDYPHAEEHQESRVAQDVEELTCRLSTAVTLRLQAEAAVGVYLSGGLDSALIAALMKRAAPDAPLRSFSIAFPDPAIC